jgi:uncharacterized repeat protein (TIGR01451 family)
MRARLRFMAWPAMVALAAILHALPVAAYTPADDLPGPPAHLETLPAGSLVIPMDNTLQNLISPFNIKAYGLASRLLQNGVPVKWAIRAGKAKDGIDFSATARRVAPTAIAAGTVNFSGGPFIVHRDFAQLALAHVAAFGGSVAVYQLTADAVVDVRYNLTHRPNIAVNADNSGIHTGLYDAAGIPHYTVIDVTVPGSIGANSCFTHISEPHTGDTAGAGDVKAFVQDGGNFLAQCLAVDTYENLSLYQTTAGYNNANTSNVLAYPNPDLAFAQFMGALTAGPGGSHQDWRLNAGSVFKNNGHVHADNTGVAIPTYAATAAKLYSGRGGNVFYLGGHSYGAGGSTLSDINGQRMVLNAIFVPATRPVSCNLDFLPNLRSFTGRVMEDVNGDSDMSDAVARADVNVRLYADLNNNGVVDGTDTYLGVTTTDANGNYDLRASTLASGNYYLVVVDSKSITPSAGLRAGYTQGDVWVDQTYGDNPATLALDLSARFGGAAPTVSDFVDAANTAPASNRYRHVARLDAASGDVAGVNFGFSFNVVTNVNGGGATDDDVAANRTVQGSLRQFIQNANAITGANAMRFVPAVPVNAGAWWRIGVTSVLPAIADANTTLDGRAYSNVNGTTVLDNNAGAVGVGGIVGVDAVALATISRPELELQNLRSTAVVSIGLDVQAASVAIRRFAIYGFGAAGNADTSANVRIGAPGASALLEQNIVGTSAGAFSDPGATARSVGDNVRLVGSSGAVVQNNAIGFSGGHGVALTTNASGAQIQANEIRGNGLTNTAFGGVSVAGGSTATIQANLIAANNGAGVEIANGAGASTILNNTMSTNRIGARLLGTGATVDRNIITTSTAAGVLAGASAAANTITRNSIFANSGIGIDLLTAANNQATGTSPFVTPNDSGDADTGGNGLLNFPVFTSAKITGGALVVEGFARPGTVIELFLAEADPSNFGEGKTYLTTLVEGSAQDTDTGTGTYTNPVNGLSQGTDTTNRFTFSIPVPAGVTIASTLTATGTLANATSEFSGNVTVAVVAGADVSGYVYEDANLNLQRDASEGGTGLTLFVKIINAANPAGPAVGATPVDPVTGGYTLPTLSAGTYSLVLDDNNTLSDVTPALPPGWTGAEMGSGIRTPVAVTGVALRSQNFGLYRGMLISGRVFNDNGIGGGVANDGTLNGGERGIAGVALKLTDTSGATVHSTATTNGGGDYALAIPSTIAAGTVLKITEANANSFISTGAMPGNTAGTYDVTTDTITFSRTANTAYTNVHFADVPPNTLSTDGQQAGLPGTTLFYAHTYTAASAGSVTFTTTSTQTPAFAGWTATLFRDANGNGQLDPGEPAINGPIAVNADEVVHVIVKVFIPVNAPFAVKDTTRITAAFNYTGANPALNGVLFRHDVTTVGNPTTAGLTLSKSVDKPTAAPGEIITYTITYKNTSTDTLRNVVIYDNTPAFTNFVSGSNGPLPPDLTGVTLTAPAPGAAGAMRWTFTGTLRSGGTGQVTFRVALDN